MKISVKWFFLVLAVSIPAVYAAKDSGDYPPTDKPLHSERKSAHGKDSPSSSQPLHSQTSDGLAAQDDSSGGLSLHLHDLNETDDFSLSAEESRRHLDIYGEDEEETVDEEGDQDLMAVGEEVRPRVL
jgi:hypothetical protein